MTQTDGSTYHLLSDYCIDLSPRFSGQFETMIQEEKKPVSKYLIERRKQLIKKMFFWSDLKYYGTQVLLWVVFSVVIILLSLLEVRYERQSPTVVMILYMELSCASFFVAFMTSTSIFKENTIIRRKNGYYR